MTIKLGLLSLNVGQATEVPQVDHKVMSTLTLDDIPKFLEAAQETL